MYKVSEFAKLFQINSSLLRYYDKEEIFSPEYRDPQTGYRYYTARQIHLFSALISARNMGYPLDELKNQSDPTAFSSDRFAQLKRQHDHFQIFLRDLEALKHAEEHKIFVYSYPAFFAVKRDYILEGNIASWNVLTQAALDLIRENISLEYAHSSHLIFHDSVYPHIDKRVTCCLAVKPDNHPWIEEVAEQRCVCIYHYGSLDTMYTAYEMLKEYIRQRNLKVCGPPSERYIRKTALPEAMDDVLVEIRLPLGSR